MVVEACLSPRELNIMAGLIWAFGLFRSVFYPYPYCSFLPVLTHLIKSCEPRSPKAPRFPRLPEVDRRCVSAFKTCQIAVKPGGSSTSLLTSWRSFGPLGEMGQSDNGIMAGLHPRLIPHILACRCSFPTLSWRPPLAISGHKRGRSYFFGCRF
jgi:hypothetical protein